MKKIYVIFIILIILSFSTYLIVKYGNNIIATKVDIRGEVKSINTLHEKVVSFLVEGQIEDDTSFDKAYVSIDENTKIYKGNSKSEIDASYLKPGDRVEVTFTGAVAESYPVQAKASIIRIIE